MQRESGVWPGVWMIRMKDSEEVVVVTGRVSPSERSWMGAPVELGVYESEVRESMRVDRRESGMERGILWIRGGLYGAVGAGCFSSQSRQRSARTEGSP